jgi:hypothetical protein
MPAAVEEDYDVIYFNNNVDSTFKKQTKINLETRPSFSLVRSLEV